MISVSMHRLSLSLLLLALVAVAIECCEQYHVCLRCRKIDTRNAPNISVIRVGKSPALALARDRGETGSSGCAYEKLAKQVIIKLGTSDNAGVQDDLVKLGCAIVHYLPHHSWSVFLPENLELDRVKRIKGVSWIGEYKPRYKVAPEWQEIFAKKLKEDVLLFNSQGRVVATVLTALARAASKPCMTKVDILELLIHRWNSSLNEDGGGEAKIVELRKLEPEAVQAAIPLERVRECVEWLSKQEWVTWIAPAFRGHLGNMLSSAIQQSGVSAPLERGAPFFPSRPLWGMGIMGDGQIVGVGDSGVDLLSCYFRDEQVPSPGPNHRKVLSYRVMWGGDLIDSYGHGSHVAGSLLGQCDQTLSDFTIESSKYNGMAPHAKLVFTDIGVGKNTYVTPPMDLSDYY